MPTYTYECAAGVEFDHEQRISEKPLQDCPVCKACTPKRLIAGAPPAFLQAGPSGGWASTGYGHTPGQLDAMRTLGRPLTKAAR